MFTADSIHSVADNMTQDESVPAALYPSGAVAMPFYLR